MCRLIFSVFWVGTTIMRLFLLRSLQSVEELLILDLFYHFDPWVVLTSIFYKFSCKNLLN